MMPAAAKCVVLLALLGCGCGRADPYQVGATVPVEGRVLIKDTPCRLPKGGYGRVWLYPDTAKGNACPQVPAGDIDADGRFRVKTRDTDGAPVGWYKVQVIARRPAAKKGAGNEPLIPARYGDPERSGLALQVVANAAPGAYDLKVRP